MIESLYLNLQHHDVLTDEEREILKNILHRDRRAAPDDDEHYVYAIALYSRIPSTTNKMAAVGRVTPRAPRHGE